MAIYPNLLSQSSFLNISYVQKKNNLSSGLDKPLFSSHDSQRHNVGTALYEALLEVNHINQYNVKHNIH